ncbi:MAG: hypothetical protein C5B59_11115 [Bacteroidetes bacterium]|nr:MAG: hypothetical protein C5B59_11115 [Bacteroidota bacterium]
MSLFKADTASICTLLSIIPLSKTGFIADKLKKKPFDQEFKKIFPILKLAGMKRMIKVLLLGLSLLLMGGSIVKAQSAADRAAKTTDWMKSNLKLSDDQVQKVTDINLRYAKTMDSLAQSTKTKEAKMDEFRKCNKMKDDDLKSVLNEDQFKEYLAKKDEMKKKLKEEMK